MGALALLVAGVLAGSTQISFGCPGPVSADGVPSCQPWHAFADARFAISHGSSRRVVVSDDRGRFRLRLAPGVYVLTPLPQRNTHGGAAVTVSVRAGTVTTTLVRFAGFPQML